MRLITQTYDLNKTNVINLRRQYAPVWSSNETPAEPTWVIRTLGLSLSREFGLKKKKKNKNKNKNKDNEKTRKYSCKTGDSSHRKAETNADTHARRLVILILHTINAPRMDCCMCAMQDSLLVAISWSCLPAAPFTASLLDCRIMDFRAVAAVCPFVLN